MAIQRSWRLKNPPFTVEVRELGTYDGVARELESKVGQTPSLRGTLVDGVHFDAAGKWIADVSFANATRHELLRKMLGEIAIRRGYTLPR